jgi:hypothetical protein
MKLVEVYDRGMTLEIPEKSCAKNHNLMLDMKIILPKGKKEIHFPATVSVIDIESTGEGTDTVVVKLLQYEEKEWQEFLNGYSSRQDEINEFLKAAKG